MKKLVKGGLILVTLMAGNVQAALVKLDMSGTVSYGYSSNSSINAGDAAKFSFMFDTSATPSSEYNYSDSSYSYSYKQYSDNAFDSYTGSIGSYTTSGTGGSKYGMAYNENSNGYNYGYIDLYDYINNGYGYKYLELYTNGNSNPINTQDLASAFLSGNLVSFYLYDYNYGNGSYDYNYAYGTLDSFKLSDPSAVPVPAAIWLFGSSLIGLLGILRRKTAPVAQIA